MLPQRQQAAGQRDAAVGDLCVVGMGDLRGCVQLGEVAGRVGLHSRYRGFLVLHDDQRCVYLVQHVPDLAGVGAQVVGDLRVADRARSAIGDIQLDL